MSQSDDDDDKPLVEVLEDEGDSEPTEEEVKEYSEFLGIDPDKEPELLWIAREGVVAPVPSPWKACQEGDEVFYFNFETQESIWDHPMDKHFRDLVEKERRKRDGGGGEGGKEDRQGSADDEENEKSFVSEAVDSDAEGMSSASPSPSGRADVKVLPKEVSSLASDKAPADASDRADDNDNSFVSEAVESDAELSSPGTSPSGQRAARSPTAGVQSKDSGASATDPGLAATDSSPRAGKALEGTCSFESWLPPARELVTAAAVNRLGTSDQASPCESKSGGLVSPQSSPGSASSNEGRKAKQIAPSIELPSSPTESGPLSQAKHTGGSEPARFERAPELSPNFAAKVLASASSAAAPTSPVLSANSSPAAGSVSSTPSAAKSPVANDATSPARSPTFQPMSSPGGGLPKDPSPKVSPNGTNGVNRPRPVLDHSGNCYSARSSNPSEVSEDFRSDWGIVTPPVSARGRNLSEAASEAAEGHSLEISATMDARSMDTDLNKSLGILSDRKSSGGECRSAEKALSQQGLPKSWQDLHLDLDVLAEALQGVKLIRSKQQEYLKRLSVTD